MKDLQMVKPYSFIRDLMPNERFIMPLLVESVVVLPNPLRLRRTFFPAEIFYLTLVRCTKHLTPGKHRSHISGPFLSFIIVAASVLKLLCGKFITKGWIELLNHGPEITQRSFSTSGFGFLKTSEVKLLWRRFEERHLAVLRNRIVHRSISG
jgi:hypothetical protein